MLKWTALPSAFVNVAVMFLAHYANETFIFFIAYAGAVLAFYGFMTLLEERG